MFHSQELGFANNLGSIIVSHSPNCPEPEEEQKNSFGLGSGLIRTNMFTKRGCRSQAGVRCPSRQAILLGIGLLGRPIVFTFVACVVHTWQLSPGGAAG